MHQWGSLAIVIEIVRAIPQECRVGAHTPTRVSRGDAYPNINIELGRAISQKLAVEVGELSLYKSHKEVHTSVVGF